MFDACKMNYVMVKTEGQRGMKKYRKGKEAKQGKERQCGTENNG